MDIAELEKQRKKICGYLWPDNIEGLTLSELFERHMTCAYEAKVSWDNRDLDRWAAWDNADVVYVAEIRKQLTT